MLCELGFAKLLARELFGLARLWVEYFFLFGVLLRFFCRCHAIATDRRLLAGGVHQPASESGMIADKVAPGRAGPSIGHRYRAAWPTSSTVAAVCETILLHFIELSISGR